MDAFLPQAIRDLAGQGTGYLLAVISWAAVLFLFKKLQNVQHNAEVARELLHEKRLVEARETLLALHEVAKAMSELADSITARTATLQAIASLASQIERSLATQFDHWQLRVTGIEEILRQLRDRRP